MILFLVMMSLAVRVLFHFDPPDVTVIVPAGQAIDGDADAFVAQHSCRYLRDMNMVGALPMPYRIQPMVAIPGGGERPDETRRLDGWLRRC